jgi:ribosomal protein S18 acetylase RimI-like enzyme
VWKRLIALVRYRRELFHPWVWARTNVFVELKWQPNAIFVREVPEEDALERDEVYPGYELIGSFGTNFWYLGPNAGTITYAALDPEAQASADKVRSAEAILRLAR